MSTHRHRPTTKPINLNKLKHKIDTKISAILAYLQNDTNFINISIPNINISNNKQQDQQSTTINKCNIGNVSEIQTQRTLQKQSLLLDGQNTERSTTGPILPQISQSTMQQNNIPLNIGQKQLYNEKRSNYSLHEGVDSVEKSDQSSSKKKIQQGSALQIFKLLLGNSSVSHHKQINIAPFGAHQQKVSKIQKSKQVSRNKSAYDGHHLRQQQKTKQNFYSPFNDKINESNKIDHSNISNQVSETKKFYEYLSTMEHPTKFISKQLIQQIKQKINKIRIKPRIETDQNVRNKLIKRILNCQNKKNLLFNQTIQ